MGTMTISVEDAVEAKFREQVREQIGTGKGTLGTAITEAMQLWVEQKAQKQITRELLVIMEKGYEMGKITYKNRDELYGRK